MRSKKYPALHQLSWTPNWVFRKYSKVKRKEFIASTGVPANEKDAARAYKIGLEKFNDWLGVYLESGRPVLVKDIARALLAAKDTKKFNTKRSFKNQIENHVLPAFGHLRPEQITPLRWQQYESDERRKGKRTRLFNTKKALVEILNRAKDEGAIRSVPKFKLSDPAAAPPKYLDAKTYRQIRRKLSRNVKLLAFIMYYQGARPNEVLQYRWDMIRWNEGETGTIHIPASITKTGRPRSIPLNSRVSRVLRWVQLNQTEGACIFPSRGDADKPIVSYNRIWDLAMESLELDYTIYNLRDTFITNRLMDGLSSTFIARYVDTSAGMIERKYAVPTDKAMRSVAG